MLNLYVCEIIKEFDYFRVGDIKKFFSYDYERIQKQHNDKIKFIGVEVLK
jgi:hypothetical protein